MKVINCLGTLDRILGLPVTTRNWNTTIAIARVLQNGAIWSFGAEVAGVVPRDKDGSEDFTKSDRRFDVILDTGKRMFRLHAQTVANAGRRAACRMPPGGER